MNVTPTGVTTAGSLVVVHGQCGVPSPGGRTVSVHPVDSVLDLKADCRGYKYVEETIKMLPEKPEPILLAKILNQVAGLGRIHVRNLPSALRNWRRY